MHVVTNHLKLFRLLTLSLTCSLVIVESSARLDVLDFDEPSNIKRPSLVPLDVARFKRAAEATPPTTKAPETGSMTTTSSPPSSSSSTPPTTKASETGSTTTTSSPPSSSSSTPVTTTTTTPASTPPPPATTTTSGTPTTTGGPTTAPSTTAAPTTSFSSVAPISLPTTEPIKVKGTTKVPDSNSSSLLSTTTTHFDARDVTYFLESHMAHSISDPRLYFTEERTSKSLTILSDEITKLPTKMRFAFMVRVFNEIGRKIASKLNYYAADVAAILRKTPDDLGNKPEVSMLVDAIERAFESKEDKEFNDQAEPQPGVTIAKLISADKEKEAVFNSSLTESAERLAHMLYHFFFKATSLSIKLSDSKTTKTAVDLLSEAVKMGAKTLIQEVSTSDKFQIPPETIAYMDRLLMMTMAIFDRHAKVGDSVKDISPAIDSSFKDLNPISDKTGLIGTWNTYLFNNLGSSERLVKLFASLLQRVPPEAKTRWINMYIAQFNFELERTLSGFVIMQGMPHNDKPSELFLLDPARSVEIMPNKMPKPRVNYSTDKNRIPARCYLAGRRWRMVLTRGLNGYEHKDEVLKGLADRIGHLKLKMVRQSGNEIYRLCMPRLEVGIRGWGINGDPRADDGNSSRFPLKNPIEGLDTMTDPFQNGVQLGYKIGFKVGYNEERNATLELEQVGSTKNTLEDKVKTEVEQLAKASYRKAATMAGKKVFQIAIHEGYLAALKVSTRAGIKIPAEAGSRMAALKCVSFGGQTGLEAGRAVVDTYMANKELTEAERKNYVEVGKAHGLLAGEIMGQQIGSIIGKEAAEESYKRGIIRGGKVARAKFHLDEYEAGADLGFEYGFKEGKRVASSSTLDPSAPRFLRWPLPVFSTKDKSNYEVDHWEKDLMPPLSQKSIEELQTVRNHITVSGSLRGTYMVAKETKVGFKRVSYSNLTYNLEVFANGFIMNDVAYLTLNGTVNNMGILRGSLIARDIFNDKDF